MGLIWVEQRSDANGERKQKQTKMRRRIIKIDQIIVIFYHRNWNWWNIYEEIQAGIFTGELRDGGGGSVVVRLHGSAKRPVNEIMIGEGKIQND